MTDSESSIQYNRRLGLILFAGYSLFYLAFALVNAFSPELAKLQPFGGINLTTWWGLSLIGLAFVLALVYGWLCRTEPTGDTPANGEKK